MAIERAKPIEFDFEGKHYTLLFNRRAVQKMEQNGFDLNNAGVKVASCAFELFSGAFYANHPFVNEREKERMFDALDKKSSKKSENGESETLYSRLIALYYDTLKGILDTDEEDAENLISWS